MALCLHLSYAQSNSKPSKLFQDVKHSNIVADQHNLGFGVFGDCSKETNELDFWTIYGIQLSVITAFILARHVWMSGNSAIILQHAEAASFTLAKGFDELITIITELLADLAVCIFLLL